ncbi:NfeD family protein [Oleispirillum naphthae]|uniref:NfeD family protein n=1 Tax=Oleispirillum naphthae TaxID=2838853 RepID=UPI0030824BE9
MTPLPPWMWAAGGAAFLAFGVWRDGRAARAIGAGALLTGAVEWGLGVSSAAAQAGLFVILSAVALIGGRLTQRLSDALPDRHRAGLGLVGRTAVAARDFRNGHGTVILGGETYAATGPSDIAAGAEVRITGLDDETLKVARKG